MNTNLCACGCGQPTKPERTFITHHNVRGSLHRSWNGGVKVQRRGYVALRRPDHPQADKQGYVKRARLVAEEKLGRLLRSDEVVHHINGVTNDDRPENLEVLPFGEHQRRHLAVRYAGGKGRIYGERISSHRLTSEQVREMWRLSATMRNRDLAEKFSIDNGQVSRILRGKAWPHIAAEFTPRGETEGKA